MLFACPAITEKKFPPPPEVSFSFPLVKDCLSLIGFAQHTFFLHQPPMKCLCSHHSYACCISVLPQFWVLVTVFTSIEDELYTSIISWLVLLLIRVRIEFLLGKSYLPRLSLPHRNTTPFAHNSQRCFWNIICIRARDVEFFWPNWRFRGNILTLIYIFCLTFCTLSS